MKVLYIKHPANESYCALEQLVKFLPFLTPGNDMQNSFIQNTHVGNGEIRNGEKIKEGRKARGRGRNTRERHGDNQEGLRGRPESKAQMALDFRPLAPRQ